VLRLLATELSGPEIAGHLYISVNTLRTHTKHIFSKLDVTPAAPRYVERWTSAFSERSGRITHPQSHHRVMCAHHIDS
jgi:DNA-binding NarL/FixJ family response regulator